MLTPQGFWAWIAAAVVMGSAHAAAATPPAVGEAFKDCATCPQMRVVPAGTFDMGSAASEQPRSDDEGPRHRVTISKPFAVGEYEVTRGEFAAFVGATGGEPGDVCNAIIDGGWKAKQGITWRAPGFQQKDDEPVVCVSWNEAHAFVNWLRQRTGKPYRLLSESEWEYVARAGQPAHAVTRSEANYGVHGECCGPKAEGDDRWLYTAPVGSFAANAFGLHDMQGNVWEWVEDCYNDTYDNAPTNGSARTSGCSMADRRGVRGGGWGDDAPFLRPAYRLRAEPQNRYFTLGFRVARDLDAPASTGWDITNTGQPYHDISFTTTEGTWMSLDVSPDGKTIVFDLLGDIYSIPATGGEATLVHGGPAMQRTPAFSPDGRKLLYVSDVSGTENAWISDPDGANPQQVSHETADLIMSVAWGADGKSIAAEHIVDAYPKRFASDILLYDFTGGRRIAVPTPENQRDVAEPTLSRDGRYIYYTQRLNAPYIYVDANSLNYGIRRRELHTGKVEDLAGGWGGALSPQLSHDGKRLAFVRRVADKTVLFVEDIATRTERAVYDGLDRDLQASYEAQVNYYPRFGWFPDDRHVAIWGKGKLFKVDMDSGAASEIPFRVTAHHRITERTVFEPNLAPEQVNVRAVRQLAQSPDGKTILFTALNHLWRKSLPDGTPVRFTNDPAVSFDGAYSRDGKRVAFVEWNDERGSALKIGTKTIATSSGVIRQPSFSFDGKRVVYRVQEADVAMGGGRSKPGIYWVDANGGESHFVTAGDELPQFSPDGTRIYYVQTDWSGASPQQVLRSVTLDGLDKREHARTVDADTTDLHLSPDLKWLAFRERMDFYVVPYRETGTPLRVSATSTEVPARKLTAEYGYSLKWSPVSSTVLWDVGPALYRARVDATGPGQQYASIGLEVPADIPTGTVAFTNARILTMQNDQVIERGTIVVTGNRIVAVGSNDAVKIPAGAKVVDASGKTILPGFIDGHGHTDCCYLTGSTPQKQPNRYAQLAYGVTTNYDPFANELTTYESAETTMAGLTVGPRWLSTGSALWGRPMHPSYVSVPINTFEDARRIVARKKAAGSAYVKSYRFPGRAQRQMLIKAAREAGLMVDIEGASELYNNITAILDGHMNLEHNLPVANYYSDIVQFMSLAHAHNTPTLVVLFGELFGENYMYQTTEAWKDPKAQTYVQAVFSAYGPLNAPGDAPPYVRNMTTIQLADEIYDIGFRSVARSVRKLDDAGVTINVGSHGEVPGLSMHWEMALLAQGGMSSMHVLRAATLNVARTLGIDKQVGSLEVGKLADLIVLDKNPLDDIHNTNSVRFTMVNGRLYDSFTLNEIGNYARPRTKFWWEMHKPNGIDWNEAWGGR
jgi:formylglycine-generating enzyme required for sulfatase activity/Tol biopolymer transport system component